VQVKLPSFSLVQIHWKKLSQFSERKEKRTKVKTWRVKTSAQKMHKLKLPSSHLIQKHLKKLRRKLSAHNT